MLPTRTLLLYAIPGMQVASDHSPPSIASLSLLLLLVSISPLPSSPGSPQSPPRIDVEPVWSGHPVGFCLITEKDRQFAAYYDANRQMTVAQRKLGETKWRFTRLPSTVGWDSHNYITMAVDKNGHLHLAGNMHVSPMTYFRSRDPLDAATLEPVKPMARAQFEKRSTYPRFFIGPDDMLLFRYRDGRSGEGNDIVNGYDLSTRQWRPIAKANLTDGLGEMNAYFSTPERGPDRLFHICGTWRDTSDCATNHSLSYARSRDLVRWETAGGKALRLPLSPKNIDIADPVKPGGGLINVAYRLGFDGAKRPVIAYHKYDAAGGSQIFCARFEGGRWIQRPVTRWKGYRWDFGGGGSIPNAEVGLGEFESHGDGNLALTWRSPHESGTFLLDEKDLRPLGKAPRKPSEWQSPDGIGRLENPTPGMRLNRAWDQGNNAPADSRFVLVWETLGANRDRPRPGPPPPPSMLRLYRLERANPR